MAAVSDVPHKFADAEGAEDLVVKALRSFDIVRSDHGVKKHT
jgi:hypothetical protein